jgi:osmotically-inducible protein OsmY
MKTFIKTAVGVLSLAFGLAACSESPKAVDNNATKMTNGDLERTVTASINGDSALVPYKIDVSGDVDKNAVTLSGTVPTEALRTRAVELAKSGRPNLLVTDKIDVKPTEIERSAYTEDMARDARTKAKASGESIGDSLDDAWIHTKIRTKLVGDGELPGGSVNVDVKNNVVTLRGSVESKEQKARVEEVAKSTEGVKSVKNLLVIKPR